MRENESGKAEEVSSDARKLEPCLLQAHLDLDAIGERADEVLVEEGLGERALSASLVLDFCVAKSVVVVVVDGDLVRLRVIRQSSRTYDEQSKQTYLEVE